MERTKIYVVTRNSAYYLINFKSIALATFSKEYANYYVWKKQKEQSEKNRYVFSSTETYEIEEIEIENENFGKDYKDFLKSRIEDVENKIESEELEVSESIDKVWKLKEKKEEYESRLESQK